jgi:hypothetical protein
MIKMNFSGDEEDKDQSTPNRPRRVDRSLSSPVVPYTRKARRELAVRIMDDDDLSEMGFEATLLLDDDRPQTELVPSYSRPMPNFQSRGSKIGDLLETNPMVFALISVASVMCLRFASNLTITMDLDIALLIIFSSFCIGLHTPRPMIGGIDKSAGAPVSISATPRFSRQSGRQLLRKSMVCTPEAQTETANKQMDFEAILEDHDEAREENQSPMPKFPEGVALGSELNRWSEPVPENFHVRGPHYLADKKKIPSGPFVFPVRGVDLFLTDTCPENAGR